MAEGKNRTSSCLCRRRKSSSSLAGGTHWRKGKKDECGGGREEDRGSKGQGEDGIKMVDELKVIVAGSRRDQVRKELTTSQRSSPKSRSHDLDQSD